MKVLFLDFDGVINSIRSAVAFGGYPWNVTAKSIKLFDPVGLRLIRMVCEKTGAKIVLSSTWRKCFKYDELGKALDLPIISATPKTLSRSRGEEIEMWLNENKVDQYAIVDDDSDMLKSQFPYFVKTCPKNGLSFENYEHLLEILN